MVVAILFIVFASLVIGWVGYILWEVLIMDDRRHKLYEETRAKAKTIHPWLSREILWDIHQGQACEVCKIPAKPLPKPLRKGVDRDPLVCVKCYKNLIPGRACICGYSSNTKVSIFR